VRVCVCVWVGAVVGMCVFVSECFREREKERESESVCVRETQRQKKREIKELFLCSVLLFTKTKPA